MLYFNMHSRHKKIIEMLQTGKVVIKEAAKSLGVTEMTIRRDLRVLEAQKTVLMVKAGAILHPARYEPECSTLMLTPEKFCLAEKLYHEIMPAKRIFIGTGSTVLAFAKVLARHRSTVTVVTHSLPVAAALFQTRHRVILIGGELRQTSMDLIGSIAENQLAKYHVQWLISGCDGASAWTGFYTADADLQHLERQEMALADHVAVVTGSEKFKRSGGVCFASPEAVSLLVTDKNIPPDESKELISRGVKIVTV
ncbi:MAG: DeoR/GlpR transcriptional regulator [Lentisphaerae bacterium]|nr:DeoR/GlpR transcriptional regulator [Lentisphaerota bacterium]